MSTPNIRPGSLLHQRRSQRILLSIRIIVSGIRPNKAPFSENTSTLVVSAHGALIRLREPVQARQQLKVKSVSTNEELSCTVIDVNPGSDDVPEVGVEFSEPCPRFWRVSFPPEDWTPRSPEAKKYTFDHSSRTPSLSKK